MFKHTCIRTACGRQYESQDEEAYYCPPCEEHKKAVAEAVTAKLGVAKTRPVRTALQEYDEGEKAHGFLRVKL